MKPLIKLRLARDEDTKAILAIYKPYITGTTISFETEVPSTETFQSRIREVQNCSPWLICEYDSYIAGYAYASQFNKRSAYNWSREVSVYIHPNYHQKGIASGLYISLLDILKLQGYRAVFAGIALPNPGSIVLHENMGFKKVAEYQKVGYKFEQWLDVGWWELLLADIPESPATKLLNLETVSELPSFQMAIQKGVNYIYQKVTPSK